LDLNQLEPSEKEVVSFLKDTASINAPEDVIVRNHIAYIPCRDGKTLTAVDVKDNKNPKVISTFRDAELAEAMGIDIWENYLFLTSMSNHTLLILDISDPEHIRKISSILIGGAGKTRDRLRKVKFHQGHLYITHSNEGKLYVVDVSIMEKPKVVGEVVTGDGAFNLHINGDYAYVGGCYPGHSLKVIDIKNPQRPILAKTLTNGDKYECLCSYSSAGNFLFAIAFHGFSLVVFDISNPLMAKEIAVLQDDQLAGANRMYLDGSKVFVASAWRDSMVEIDVSNPLKPVISRVVTSHLLNKAYGVTGSMGQIYVVGRDADSLVLIDN
jgi:hypothetical protein